MLEKLENTILFSIKIAAKTECVKMTKIADFVHLAQNLKTRFLTI